jgi:hypothetical protein
MPYAEIKAIEKLEKSCNHKSLPVDIGLLLVILEVFLHGFLLFKSHAISDILHPSCNMAPSTLMPLDALAGAL